MVITLYQRDVSLSQVKPSNVSQTGKGYFNILYSYSTNDLRRYIETD